jgi:RNA polymerase-binding transcription factor DksA
MLSQQFIDEMKQALVAQKQKLEAELKGLRAHTELGDDYDENATEVQLDDVNQDLIIRMAADLDKIEKALGKIEDGTYGAADDGREISEERLRALPWADTAI